MIALILAAGRGRRLGKLTEQLPKALVSTAGIPLLGRILYDLESVGVREAWIVVGFKGDEIRHKIREDYAGLKIHYVENPNYKQGNLYSLLAAHGLLEKNFILCMSDHLFDASLVKKLIDHRLKGAVALAIDREKNYAEGDTRVFELNGRIINIGKSIEEWNCIDTGFFLCSPRIFEYVSTAAEQGESELTDAIRLAAQGRDAEIVDVSGLFWANINTVEDLKRGKSVLAERTQKGRGASDLVAHYINRPIENKIIYYISDSAITPNQLTIMTNIIAWSVTVLFLLGHLLAGSILTFIVGVMDGLDGKLARLKKRTTKLGLMEHPFDMLFEFSWLIALALYLSRNVGSLPLILSLITITLIAFYRFCYDQFGKAMKISLDVYAPFEKAFRRIAGRRNLYNIHILAWIILGMPLYSLYTIMSHSVLTALIYAYRACKHLHNADKSI